MFVQPADFAQVGRACGAFRHTCDQEEVGFDHNVVDQVKHGPRDGQGRVERKTQDHIADLADDVERQDLAEIVLRGCAQNASDHGKPRHPQKDRMGKANVTVKDQGEHADQRVDTNLGQ